MSKIKTRISTFLKASGAVLLFGSWVYQNYNAAIWTQELEGYHRYAEASQEKFHAMNQWYIFFISFGTDLKEESELSKFRTAAVNYITNASSVLYTNRIYMAETLEERNMIMNNRYEYTKRATALANKKLNSALYVMVENLRNEINSELEGRVKAIEKNFQKIVEREKLYTRLYIGLYILGGIFTALGFVFGQRSVCPSCGYSAY